jgi:hypothetical protein
MYSRSKLLCSTHPGKEIRRENKTRIQHSSTQVEKTTILTHFCKKATLTQYLEQEFEFYSRSFVCFLQLFYSKPAKCYLLWKYRKGSSFKKRTKQQQSQIVTRKNGCKCNEEIKV